MSWDETSLWVALQQSQDRSLTLATELLIGEAEKVLRSGSTAPSDFTLHDDQHSCRVASRMIDFIGSTNLPTLSDIELSILLSSAYLHDIGMSPPKIIIEQYQHFLLSGTPGRLTATELKSFQHWLDVNYPDASVPMAPELLSSSGILAHEEIIAYFIRHKHNDWSEDWIKTNSSRINLPYPGWIDNIVTVCRSHHEGLTELKSDRFDSYMVGTPPRPVNLRFLAAILRLSDVLEFDPERTPSVILEHRNISPKSRIYWHKDHDISCSVSSNHTISVHARTPSAVIHKAVIDTIDSVNRELTICRILSDGGYFGKGTIPSSTRSEMLWHWPTQCTSDIRENGDFVYIDGAFRPDSKRVLELLSGLALYKSPLVAVRELLQNAFDAIAVQIAYERLDQDNPESEDLARRLADLHTVKLSVEKDGEYLWLRCSDDGVGMTRDVIEQSLLVSGSQKRPDILQLERAVAERGFKLGRTGQFGIGTLSYFMIADQVELLTRRSAEAGDIDATAWRFTSAGIGSFGELSKESRSKKGTEIRLRLRQDKFPMDSAYQSIANYVRSIVLRTPCKLELRDQVNGSPTTQIPPGWVNSTQLPDLETTYVYEDYNPDSGILATEAETERKSFIAASWNTLRAEAAAALRWHGPFEHKLKSIGGTLRIAVPYFELDGDACLLLSQFKDGRIVKTPSDDDAIKMPSTIKASWHGFKVSTTLSAPNYSTVDVDLFDGANISASRDSLSFDTRSIDKEIRDRHEEAMKSFLITFDSSRHSAINRAVSRRKKAQTVPYHWTVTPASEGAYGSVSYPFAEVISPEYDTEPLDGKYVSGGSPVTVVRPFKVGHVGRLSGTSTLSGGRFVLARRGSKARPARLWRSAADVERDLCEFPKSLQMLAGAASDTGMILNRDHPLNINRPMRYDFQLSRLLELQEPNEIHLVSIIRIMMTKKHDRWLAIKDGRRDLWNRMTDRSILGGESILYWDYQAYYANYIVELSADGVTATQQPNIISTEFAMPSGKIDLPDESDFWLVTSDGR